ncbi:YHS domain-containing protein [bacterium]|nr:YHS domain-containing protein [bacterium]
MFRKMIVPVLVMALAVLAGVARAEEQPLENTVIEGNVWTTADGGKYFTCPVMKGEGVVGNEDGVTVLNGVTFYHCCPPCQGPFRKNPDKWLGELYLPANVTTVDAKGVKHFKDPVNGDEGTVEENTRVLDKDGKRWYFSTKRSLKSFRKNPEKYVSMD